MKTMLTALAVVFTLLNAPAVRAADAHHDAEGKAVAPVSAVMTDGEVRKVDKATKKITLKHEEIKSLDMPPMTMVFRVKDPDMLNKVKPGDKVKFAAENVDGAIVITAIEAAK